MDTKNILQTVSSHGLVPILVEGDVERENAQDPIFIGSLDDYLASAKVLEGKAIFVSVDKLDESDFIFEIEDDDEDSSDNYLENELTFSHHESTKIDLTIVVPSLSTYKDRIGIEYSFKLSIAGGLTGLEFYLEEPWWKQFVEKRNDAINKIEEDREAYREKMEKQRIETEKEFIKTIRLLIKDGNFVRIPTQRGMMNYVLENFPDMQISPESLRDEIRKLWDKIIAKGLRKKGR